MNVILKDEMIFGIESIKKSQLNDCGETTHFIDIYARRQKYDYDTELYEPLGIRIAYFCRCENEEDQDRTFKFISKKIQEERSIIDLRMIEWEEFKL